MQNKKNNKIVIGVIVLVIAALGFVLLQNKTGLFKGVLQIVSPRDVSLRNQPSTVTITRVRRSNQYNLRIEDNNGLRRYAVMTILNEKLATMRPEETANTSYACGGDEVLTYNVELVVLAPRQFPLTARVEDCNGNSTAVSVPMPPLKALR